MRIAFVQDIIQFSVPLGTALIAGSLRHGGHKVEVYIVDNNLDKTINDLKQFKPDAVAFSVITGSHLEYIKIARTIKNQLNIPIIWGGPHATFFPKIIEEDYADAVCVGEGEDAANLAHFLLSKNSSWITGQIIGVDGGRAAIA